MVRYKQFEDWFNEQESYGLRSERFFSLVPFRAREAELLGKWLEAAFNAGREEKKHCKYPNCDCPDNNCVRTIVLNRN